MVIHAASSASVGRPIERGPAGPRTGLLHASRVRALKIAPWLLARCPQVHATSIKRSRLRMPDTMDAAILVGKVFGSRLRAASMAQSAFPRSSSKIFSTNEPAAPYVRSSIERSRPC